MWDHLLSYRSELPEGIGWQHFGPEHLTYLAAFAIATVVMVMIYRRGDDKRRKHIQITYAVIVVALEVIKDALCIIKGVWEPGLFPFHLCGMTIVFIVIHTIRPNKWTATLLYSLSMPGAFAALVFSDWTAYPLLNFFCQQSFFIHFFELTFPILLISGKEIRPRFTDLWRSVIYLLIVVPPIYFFNLAYGTNFFFMNTAVPGSPLAPLQTLGTTGYLLGFAALVVAFWVIIYLPWMIKSLRERRAASVSAKGTV